MTGFDVQAALTNLAALVDTIPGQDSVQVGAPESLPAQMTTWVTLGAPEVVAAAVPNYDLNTDLLVWFGYAVAGAETDAEVAIAAALVELVRRVITNRVDAVDGVGRMLGGTVDDMAIPRGVASAADYAMFAGTETRVYPVAIRVTQTETIGG